MMSEHVRTPPLPRFFNTMARRPAQRAISGGKKSVSRKRVVGGAEYPGRIWGDIRSGVVVRRRPHKAAGNQMMIHCVCQQLEPGVHTELPVELRQMSLDRHFGDAE